MVLRKLVPIVVFLAILSIPSLAATIQPSSFDTPSINPGNSYTKSITLTATNETCTLMAPPSNTPYNWVLGMPQSISAINNQTTTFTANIGIQVPSDAPSGTYTAKYNYTCDSSTSALLSMNILVAAQANQQCNLIVTIVGSRDRGKTMGFDIRDTNYNAKDGIIYITRADGTTDRLDCAGGFCTWVIPPTEEGPLITRIIVANCSPMTKQIDLTGTLTNTTDNSTEITGGKISIYGPTTVNVGGENYQFLVVGQNKPLKLSDISIIGPNGYTFSGTTNDYGLVVDSSLKIFGTAIQPTDTGAYTIFISREGFSPTQFEFSVVKKDCPYDCCPATGNYVAKECNANNNCVDNKCVPNVKPKMTVTCSPASPMQFEAITCSLKDPSGSLITGNVQGTMNKGTLEENIVFVNGVWSLDQGFDSPGTMQIAVPATTQYDSAAYSSDITAPQVPWTMIYVIIIVAIVIILLLWIWKRRKGGGGGTEYPLESSVGPLLEKTSYEK